MFRLIIALGFALGLSGCLASAVVKTTGAVVGTAVKTTGAVVGTAVDLAIPDGDDEGSDKEDETDKEK